MIGCGAPFLKRRWSLCGIIRRMSFFKAYDMRGTFGVDFDLVVELTRYIAIARKSPPIAI